MSKSIQVNRGDRVSIIANPNPNYGFINWTLVRGTLNEDLSNPRLSFIPTEDTELMANFKDTAYHINPSEIDNAGSNLSYVKNEYKSEPYNFRVHSNSNVVVITAFLTFDLNSRFKDDITNVKVEVINPSPGRLPMLHTLMYNGNIRNITNHRQSPSVDSTTLGHFTINRTEAEELGYVTSTSIDNYTFAYERFTLRYTFTFKDGTIQSLDKPYRS